MFEQPKSGPPKVIKSSGKVGLRGGSCLPGSGPELFYSCLRDVVFLRLFFIFGHKSFQSSEELSVDHGSS